MAYEMVMPYHLHMPSYFLETFTEYPILNKSRFDLTIIIRLGQNGFILKHYFQSLFFNFHKTPVSIFYKKHLLFQFKS